jgi:hypothetical protein
MEPESTDALFRRLADQWADETTFVSSSTEMVLNGAYQRIIGMGPAALPLILRRLESTGGHWFWALKYISGEDPVPADNLGDYEQMRGAWLNWGREHQFL